MAKKAQGQKILRATEAVWVLPENRHHVYSNVVAMRNTNWDMTMRFGEIKDCPGIGNIELEEVANITMSPGHFKEFVRVVSSQLAAFEEANGEIQVIVNEPNSEPGTH